MSISPYHKKLRDALPGEILITPGVGAIIRDAHGRILITKRSDDGQWDLPGGAVDLGETPSEAVRREVREETGLEVQPVRVAGVFSGREFRHEYPNGDQVEGFTVVFECRATGGELHSEDGETSRFRYVSADDMPPLTAPYPRELFDDGAPAFV